MLVDGEMQKKRMIFLINVLSDMKRVNIKSMVILQFK